MSRSAAVSADDAAAQHVDAGFWIAETPSKLRAIRNTREPGDIERRTRCKASLRAKAKPPFRLMTRQFGDVTVRDRGLATNTAQVLALRALSNRWMARGRLMPNAG